MTIMNFRYCCAMVCVLALMANAINTKTYTASPTPTTTSTTTPSTTDSPTHTPTPTHTNTATTSITASSTPSPTITPTSVPTHTPSASPTATETPSATLVNTHTPTDTATLTRLIAVALGATVKSSTGTVQCAYPPPSSACSITFTSKAPTTDSITFICSSSPNADGQFIQNFTFTVGKGNTTFAQPLPQTLQPAFIISNTTTVENTTLTCVTRSNSPQYSGITYGIPITTTIQPNVINITQVTNQPQSVAQTGNPANGPNILLQPIGVVLNIVLAADPNGGFTGYFRIKLPYQPSAPVTVTLTLGNLGSVHFWINGVDVGTTYTFVITPENWQDDKIIGLHTADAVTEKVLRILQQGTITINLASPDGPFNLNKVVSVNVVTATPAAPTPLQSTQAPTTPATSPSTGTTGVTTTNTVNAPKGTPSKRKVAIGVGVGVGVGGGLLLILIIALILWLCLRNRGGAAEYDKSTYYGPPTGYAPPPAYGPPPVVALDYPAPPGPMITPVTSPYYVAPPPF